MRLDQLEYSLHLFGGQAIQIIQHNQQRLLTRAKQRLQLGADLTEGLRAILGVFIQALCPAAEPRAAALEQQGKAAERAHRGHA
ncbi:hypothetical protein D3C77_303470 [compost metagenome]